MRILYQLNQLGYGGTERVVLSLAKHGISHGHDIAIYLSNDTGSVSYHRRRLWSLFNERAKERFTLRYVDSMARLNEATALVGKNFFTGFGCTGLQKAIKCFSPDVVHVNRGLENDFYTNPDCYFHGSKILETNIFGKSSNAHYLKKVDKIVFISNWLRKKSCWADNMNTATIYNPISVPTAESHFSLRKHFGISENEIVIGRICRPDLDDGSFVLSVVNELRKKTPAIHFIWMGAPKKISESSEHVKNHTLPSSTRQDEIEGFYSAIDILLHYRLEGETFGMVIAEAMLRGIPVVSHSSLVDNAQAELLLSHGPAGVVIDKSTTQDFSRALTYLIENPKLRIALGNEGSRIARLLFKEDDVAKAYFQHYEEISS